MLGLDRTERLRLYTAESIEIVCCSKQKKELYYLNQCYCCSIGNSTYRFAMNSYIKFNRD